ncbi:hypothetical protein CFOL_v3_01334 [Cephalotus follicularis]|uniref:Uncharacterized protein n=1 Tax=Cephalotus follicularis TaxID=3775 RepID=A0A1Q3APZ1_CEPFO|nr:hypothetical protein CFOL_v3_01334 [Cephalotus follicularis]
MGFHNLNSKMGVEVYTPNHCARQFGFIQGIPLPNYSSLNDTLVGRVIFMDDSGPAIMIENYQKLVTDFYLVKTPTDPYCSFSFQSWSTDYMHHWCTIDLSVLLTRFSPNNDIVQAATEKRKRLIGIEFLFFVLLSRSN